MFTMIDLMMAVNRYCADCIKNGQFLPLRFVMMNLSSGVWVCSKDECVFPMNSPKFSNYMEENMTSEKVLLLTKTGTGARKTKKSKHKISKGLSASKLKQLSAGNPSSSPSSRSHTSDDTSIHSSAYSDTTTVSLQNDNQLPSCSAALYPLWENEGLLCWLDVILSMLVLNDTLNKFSTSEKSDGESFVTELCFEYRKILSTFNKETSYVSVKPCLNKLRKHLLDFLQPKLLENVMEADSPLFSLSLVLKTDHGLEEQVEFPYCCIFKCSACGFEKREKFQKVILSMDNTNEDMRFPDNLFFTRSCYMCFTAQQTCKIEIERYPNILYIHFKEGVRSKQYWKDYKFTTKEGEQYVITQIIQFVGSKKHFVLWSYNTQEKLWLYADDLNDPVVGYKYKRPKCRPEEVRMLVWERQSNLRHSESPTAEHFLFALNKNDVPLSSPSDFICSTASWDGASRMSYSKPPSLSSNDSPLPSPLFENVTKTSKNMTKTILSVQRYKPYIPKSKCKNGDTVMANVNSVNSESISENMSLELESKQKVVSRLTDNTPSLDQVTTILSQELDGCYNELVYNALEHSDSNVHARSYPQSSDGNYLETGSPMRKENVSEQQVAMDADIELMGTLPSVDFHMDTGSCGDCCSTEFSLDDILL